jgi:hypothetical protein
MRCLPGFRVRIFARKRDASPRQRIVSDRILIGIRALLLCANKRKEMTAMTRTMRFAIVLGSLALLAGCGNREPGRVAGGAATGAGTGAVVGAIAGPPGALGGAAIGAGVGAGTAAVTSPNQVNLGKPVWQQPMKVGPVTNP